MDNSSFGTACTLWTVRFSVLLYSVAVLAAVANSSAERIRARDIYRWSWFGAWLLCVIHVVCAFHFIHRWSHDAAMLHTAEMTERVVGLHWSGGLFINYIFLTWWGVDAFLQFRNRNTSKLMHPVAAFMMFNATVVFGPSWWIIPTAIVCLLVVGIARATFMNRTLNADRP